MTLFHSLRSKVQILVLGLILGLPLVGCGNMSMLSREQEIALGEQHAPRFLSEGGGEVRDATTNNYVASIGQKLVAALPPEHRRKMPWEFRVLDSAVINAFALPGGKVFISRGLLEKLENEAELAGVLGHEIGHVTAQHIGKQMTQQMMIKTGLSILTSA
ncbi:MAG: M48 family metalloprotease, partial [Phycisphaerae bacterium]|nr:M48 family metalloprotease [Phycisphaerae bacterium]